ncbi:hypothetical protein METBISCDRAFT_30654 [Metschnikowia bicuspidata]|uniref:Phosphatidylglycerol/phosphatidylinositol transfer protein n=1 Tax=Metschnikowia bicuspidata TaxID=27322 RepID=A0A4P9ZFJ8_9ASCO|nr:hypothetical protein METBISCDRAFT_30654 [Metschnikowia bicuspidata]
MVSAIRLTWAFWACSVSGFLIPALQIFEDAAASFVKTFSGPNEKPVPGNAPIVQCDVLTPQVLKLQHVTIDPNPPVRGRNLTFTATGLLSQDIVDGAYVKVDVRFGFIRLIKKTYDLCEQVQNIDLKCPIRLGKQEITKTVEIPADVPPGRYIVNARAYNKDDELITCLTVDLTVDPGIV